MAVVELSRDPRPSTVRAALGLLARRRGDTVPDVELVRRGVGVDRDHLAAYDRVCGFRLSDELPPTYPHVLAFPLALRLLTAPDFPFAAIGLIHVANRITVRRPLTAGMSLDLAVRATGPRPHERGRQVDVVTTATVDGEDVWTGVSTYLSRSRDSRSGAPGERPEHGAPVASAVWRLPARVGPDYAGVSGDRNPIHTSRIGARLFGFPRPIAHGMWSAARCLAALEGRLPGSCTVDVRFRRPILLPATVSFAHADGAFQLFGEKPHLAGHVSAA
ncbi:MaoC family dehydratase [Actinoplanes sp. M2I2]|uniref:MaoC family dehydratase n=1 Tax=Actinoplanes sp. M2I2 TaxID=1734444 RepID=UPI002020AB68|nr:MaoC/PaaZ C-terminal domain-containing protein [Actinoplanes sp. M2I2]